MFEAWDRKKLFLIALTSTLCGQRKILRCYQSVSFSFFLEENNGANIRLDAVDLTQQYFKTKGRGENKDRTCAKAAN